MSQASFYCPQCQTMKLFVGEEMSHAAHILASVFLCGLWLPIWLLLAATYKPQYRCSNCGYTDGVNYLADPTLRSRQTQAAHYRANQRVAQKARYLDIAEQSEGWRKPFYKFLSLEHSTAITIGTLLVGGFICLAAISSIFSVPKQSSQYISPTPQISPTSRNIQLNDSTPKISPSQKPIQTPKKTVSANKTATVIGENANLRTSPDSFSEVVESLPKGSSVQVLRQKGAWFYVSSGIQEGWVHGNTIRLE